ncbi:conserved Plasmodium protein, unknown function [Plasmodium gallinaceum]|uniref:Protein TOC75 n=1 Tax=Plasmodium gallinaceum TaxID=5849 RepID=A0A1J1GXG0_PLAGA|nr:conserved Plasmodium protein, unknown function [Plasmodium gallinaceum]CRG96982.1 conserved Plasmodium protein, unknown function [Plasmodium gallinaceum]
MKNVLRIFRYLIILIYFFTYCNSLKKECKNELNKLNNNYYEKCLQNYKKVNGKKFFYLENKKSKLKRLWDDLTKRYSRFHTSNTNPIGKNENLIEKKFNNFNLRDNYEIINKAIINNSTVINEYIFRKLLKDNNIETIKYKDINTIIKIINEYYMKNNHIFSEVRKYEVKREGNQNILIIYVNELILDKNSIKINIYKVEKKKDETENLKKQDILDPLENEIYTNRKIIFEKKDLINKDIINYELKRKDKVNDKLKEFFKKKMNIKENSIFTWNEYMYDLIIKSNIFNYINTKLYVDKISNKYILEINLIENKNVIFIPSISKSFNSFLEFCLNLSFAYFHLFRYSDKMKIKFFQNLNYKNNKHNYDFVYLNDVIEIEKLKNNYPNFLIYGLSLNKTYKNELEYPSLNKFMNFINDENKNKVSINDYEVQEDLSFDSKYSIYVKDIYNYLYKKKLFIFFIKKINNTIFEVKMKIKKNLIHNFFYFIKSEKKSKLNNDLSRKNKLKNLFLFKYFKFMKDEEKYILFNKLYNIYKSKFKFSYSLDVYNQNFFERCNFLKKYFNINNKIDLIFYLNNNEDFYLKSDNNTSNNDSKNVQIELLSFLKNINKKGYILDKINNVYLNYTIYFCQNYRIKLSNLFYKINKLKTNDDKKKEKSLCNEDSLYAIPLYICKIPLDKIHLLLNLEFSLKKNIWKYKKSYKNNKEEKKEYNNENTFNIDRKKSQDNLVNIKEDIQQIKVFNNRSKNDLIYDISNINLNKDKKENMNKMNCILHYKLIFPLLFKNNFLNLLNMKFYFFINYKISDDKKSDNYFLNKDKKLNAYDFLKLHYLKIKKKNPNSSYGIGAILSNINVFLNFKFYSKSMLPSIILQFNQDHSKFKYLL